MRPQAGSMEGTEKDSVSRFVDWLDCSGRRSAGMIRPGARAAIRK
jgi:hypothetical protein